MILKASERGGAKQLASHLLNDHDNEHIDVHEVRGFVSSDVLGAFKEAYAVSQGTRCKNFLFSVSLSPPEQEDVSIKIFENTLERIEARTGLAGQPRVVVIHEKNGRRHAHCVWSRIDAETMTAKNLSHYKNKLQDISRETYLEHNWKMPNGLVRGEIGDPKNYTLEQWQQCKRMGLDASELKGMMQDCWAASDSPAAFKSALKERGLVLAKGDRRGHVAVTYEGEVLSIARYVGKKAREVHAMLGDTDGFPSVEQARAQIAQDMRSSFQRHTEQVTSRYQQTLSTIEARRTRMVIHQREERQKQENGQRARWDEETRQRSMLLNSGLKGIWQRVIGQHRRIQQQNELEAYQALKRDREQRDALVRAQMNDRRKLQVEIKSTRGRQIVLLRGIREDQKHYREMERDPKTDLHKHFDHAQSKPGRTPAVKATTPGHQPDQQTVAPTASTILTPQERLEKLRVGQTAGTHPINKAPEFER